MSDDAAAADLLRALTHRVLTLTVGRYLDALARGAPQNTTRLALRAMTEAHERCQACQ